MGNLNDGSDSGAEIVEPASHWPNMHALILVASDGRKKVIIFQVQLLSFKAKPKPQRASILSQLGLVKPSRVFAASGSVWNARSSE